MCIEVQFANLSKSSEVENNTPSTAPDSIIIPLLNPKKIFSYSLLFTIIKICEEWTSLHSILTICLPDLVPLSTLSKLH